LLIISYLLALLAILTILFVSNISSSVKITLYVGWFPIITTSEEKVTIPTFLKGWFFTIFWINWVRATFIASSLVIPLFPHPKDILPETSMHRMIVMSSWSCLLDFWLIYTFSLIYELFKFYWSLASMPDWFIFKQKLHYHSSCFYPRSLILQYWFIIELQKEQ